MTNADASSAPESQGKSSPSPSTPHPLLSLRFSSDDAADQSSHSTCLSSICPSAAIATVLAADTECAKFTAAPVTAGTTQGSGTTAKATSAGGERATGGGQASPTSKALAEMVEVPTVVSGVFAGVIGVVAWLL
ncbi:hypothetical protein K458DRAFT_143798 [Lentithecium fluviatile CBS 122367]|uniref:Uncharacterized protein n=1 Tax=Lentithecium fluviatile CBS 122367 TaxID=1168545 RepID=A0A6G1IIM1_9PLEO|nr:hypothetical protein K458DRAFT_143798 [Lentithecium fluviatile CBS 122367]